MKSCTRLHSTPLNYFTPHYTAELRSCVKVEEANLGSPSLIVCTVSVDVKQHYLVQSAGFSLKTQPTLVTSYILSRLDYCNCLLMGTPNSVIQPLQKILNFAARLVLLAPRHHHLTPLLEKLHWLPISERIKYKVACMCFSAISGSGLAYLSELLLSLIHI